jgi:hypothetical protein
MASERVTPWVFAHASNSFIASISKRAGMVPAYLAPGGRPIFFLCTILSCLVMSICVQERQAEGKR